MPDKSSAPMLAALVIVVIGACTVILCLRGDVSSALTFAALLAVSPLQILQFRAPPPVPPPPGTLIASSTKSIEVTPP